MMGWKMALLSLDGRLDLVKSVLSAMPIFQMIALHMPAWLQKLIDKVRQEFLWGGQEVTIGRKCLADWKLMCRPTDFGGLGIIDLAAQSAALRVLWLWKSWAEPGKPWHGLDLPINQRVRNLFNASVLFHLGDGARISF